MDRPFVFCHMLSSLDGKIVGPFMSKVPAAADETFYREAFTDQGTYRNQGWLSGRITTDKNFTFYRQPDVMVDEKAPAGDYVTRTSENKYYLSVDPHGVLGWTKNTLQYNDTTATVLEILTENASEAYRAYLRRLQIPYIIAGKDQLDAPLALEKLKHLFGLESIMLGGGGILNWSFIRAGLCDELSLILAPVADGSPDTAALFNAVPGMADNEPVTFKLKAVKQVEDALWLRYTIES